MNANLEFLVKLTTEEKAERILQDNLLLERGLVETPAEDPIKKQRGRPNKENVSSLVKAGFQKRRVSSGLAPREMQQNLRNLLNELRKYYITKGIMVSELQTYPAILRRLDTSLDQGIGGLQVETAQELTKRAEALLNEKKESNAPLYPAGRNKSVLWDNDLREKLRTLTLKYAPESYYRIAIIAAKVAPHLGLTTTAVYNQIYKLGIDKELRKMELEQNGENA